MYYYLALNIDTSTPLYALEFIYVGPKPKPISPRWNFVKPYAVSTWIGIIGTILLLLAVVTVTGMLDTFAIVAIFFSQGILGLFWSPQ